MTDFLWRWKNFKPAEVLGRDGLDQYIHHRNLMLQPFALDALQGFRNSLGLPIVVTSGYRSERENNACAGKTFSRHVQGIAFDIRVPGMGVHELFEKAKDWKLFGGVGLYIKKNFVHVDARPRLTKDPIWWVE